MRRSLLGLSRATLVLLTLIAVASWAHAEEVRQEDLALDLSGLSASKTVEPYFLALDPAAGGFRLVDYDEYVAAYKLEGKVLTKAKLISVALSNKHTVGSIKADLEGQGESGLSLAAGLYGFKIIDRPKWLPVGVALLAACVVVAVIAIVRNKGRRRTQVVTAKVESEEQPRIGTTGLTWHCSCGETNVRSAEFCRSCNARNPEYA